MNVFYFDNTFEGLLTAVFEAYARHTFPDELLPKGAALPLFAFNASVISSRSNDETIELKSTSSP